ncbi:MAG TPA: UvrD-helicase domain-containing protein [Gemmatimonadales bacterium]|nr:UvrD-helicase domain-containing protein [Gemmatimonadales bacterium]
MNSPETASLTGLAGLNPAQREAVEHVTGPLLVVAGAGSGKTRVLTLRIARLIDEHGVDPRRILAVTFTNKAAGEMKERVGRMLGRDPSGLWIGTFHSLSARLLRHDAEALGFTRQFTIYDEDDRLSLIKRILEQKGHPPKLFPPRVIQAIISGAKNRLTPPSELAGSSPFDRVTQVAAEVYGALNAALKSANAMDFDDLLLHPLTLFRERPDRLAYWRDRFTFLLVDEFQDTNQAQYQFVRQLGAHGNLAAVGDDDQSIYGWRGADVRNMLDFQKDFPGTRVVRLEENYRSTATVLNAANAVIAENPGRLGKTLRTRRQGGEAITLVASADERDEAEWVIRELSSRSARSDWALNEMAILYRTNSQSRAFEEALRRAGLPYRIIGAISFYDRREVKDLLAYLRLIANPADDEAFLRAVAVPRRGLGESSLIQLQQAAARWNQPLLATARVAERVQEFRPSVKEALRKFAEQLDGLRETAGGWTPAQVIEQVIRVINYEKILEEEGPEGVERMENVREMLASAADWSEVAAPEDEESGTTPLERFLAEAALLSGNDKIKGNESGVTLMTLHTAKGLEWPVVVLAGMEDGLFPLARADEQPGGVEEERRLCYVGLTRAKDKLYLSWARARRRGGELRPSRASRFLAALPPELVEEKRTSSLYTPSSAWGDGGQAGRRTGGQWGTKVPAPRPVPVEPEEASQDQPRYVKGERVRHRRFGGGVIQGLTGTGRDLKVSVAFDDEEIGVKQLLVAYAGLERDMESA